MASYPTPTEGFIKQNRIPHDILQPFQSSRRARADRIHLVDSLRSRGILMNRDRLIPPGQGMYTIDLPRGAIFRVPPDTHQLPSNPSTTGEGQTADAGHNQGQNVANANLHANDSTLCLSSSRKRTAGQANLDTDDPSFTPSQEEHFTPRERRLPDQTPEHSRSIAEATAQHQSARIEATDLEELQRQLNLRQHDLDRRDAELSRMDQDCHTRLVKAILKETQTKSDREALISREAELNRKEINLLSHQNALDDREAQLEQKEQDYHRRLTDLQSCRDSPQRH